MTNGQGVARDATPWKARALHHDAERFLRAPGCSNCLDRELCGGLNTATRLLDCMELCCGKPDKCTWVCRRNSQFKSQMQEVGGLRLENISITGRPSLPELPPVVPLIYHGYSRAKPFDSPAVAIKLAQTFDKRTGALRFTSREDLCRSFAIASSTNIIVSGVDQDPAIERWWGIGKKSRLQVIEAMRSIGISLVTAPDFSLCVDWPRYGDMAAMKRIGRAFAELMDGGVAASLHVNGRTDMDFQRWARLLRRNEAVRRVRIGTAALIMPYRNPVLLARMMVTLDHFSGGRIVLGAGVGWLEEEFNVLDAHDFKRRGKVTDEYLDIFKAICAGGEVGYRGETYSFEPIFSSPGSLQRPHPPILIGGLSDAALRRVVRHGNGWLAVTASAEMLAERLATLKRLTHETGQRYEDLLLTYKMFLNIGEAKRSRFDAREPGTGSIAEITDDIKRLFDLGFQKIIVRYRGSSATDLRSQIDRFVTEIVPIA